jgi:hypothetical protein
MPRHQGSGVHIASNIGANMSADPFTTKANHSKYLIALGLLLTLAGIGTTIQASTTHAAAIHHPEATASNTTATCADAGDVFELDVPGTYTAFATTSTGALPTHVRGSHGEVLATTHATTYNPVPVDDATGAQFGIAPPQVFELTSKVMIHVESQDAPYKLVIVRLGEDDNEDRIDIQPPVERVLNESGSCLIGDLREYFRIRTDAVYSALNARQVFVISPSDKA